MADPAYGYQHQQRRAAWNRELERTGPIACRRCGHPVHCDRDAHLNRDARKFDLGHGVGVKHGGKGDDSQPECASCNRAAGAAVTNAPRASREWG